MSFNVLFSGINSVALGAVKSIVKTTELLPIKLSVSFAQIVTLC